MTIVYVSVIELRRNNEQTREATVIRSRDSLQNTHLTCELPWNVRILHITPPISLNPSLFEKHQRTSPHSQTIRSHKLSEIQLHQ